MKKTNDILGPAWNVIESPDNWPTNKCNVITQFKH